MPRGKKKKRKKNFYEVQAQASPAGRQSFRDN
jgi:hypothetical protein